jgi:hypothetical protein
MGLMTGWVETDPGLSVEEENISKIMAYEKSQAKESSIIKRTS